MPLAKALCALSLAVVVLAGCHRAQLSPSPSARNARFALTLSASLTADTRTAPLGALIAEAERLLPQTLKQRIAGPIVVDLDPTKDAAPIAVPRCVAVTSPPAEPPVQTLGTSVVSHDAAPHHIFLHPGLIAIAQAGSAQSPRFSCGHRSLYRLALATVLHEVLHIYDQLARLSDDPVYQHMQQFARQGASRSLRAHNQLRVRSPDIYEFHDIVENLAVNFEYFILDPNFKCRRPSVYHYLSTQFQHQPASIDTCAINTLVYAGNRPVYIDPARIYQIHYLFAARGKGIASRFGHSMFRIVSCAPSRTRVDEHCLEDLHEHLVLSFIANLRDDLTIKAWKGLTGKYMSQLLIRPLTEILNDYTEIDHRDLQSIPLKMNAQEMRIFIYHALELYWGYSGRYYFVTNNCADESLRLVQSTVPRDELQEIDIITPLGLRDALAKKHIADMSVLTDRAVALEKGHLFQSAIERYEALYRRFRDTLPSGRPRSLDGYLKNTTAERRRAWASAVLTRPESLAGLFTLEGLVHQRLLKDIERTILVRVLFRRDQRYVALGQKLQEHLKSLRLPWELVTAGYGIPLPDEFRLEPRDVRPSFPEEILTVAMSLIKNDDPKLYNQYVETEQNRRFMLSEILKSSTAAARREGTDPIRVGDQQ